jgi:PAS domain S-box-containing protein
MEATAAILDLGESEGVLVTVRDVSHQKTTEAELKRNEEKFRKVMDATGYGYFEVDLFGNFTYQNAYSSEVLGLPKNGLIGTNYTEIMDKENAAKVYQCYNKIYQENLNHEEIEYRIQTSEGNWVYIKALVAPLKNAADDIIGFGAIARNYTKQLKADREIEKMHKKNIDMAHAAGMAEMASDTLHNVGNVLNSIKISAESISETFRTGTYDFKNLIQATNLLNQKFNCTDDFIANDPNNKKLLEYLVLFSDGLQQEKLQTLENIDRLLKGVRVVENIVAAQQTYASLESMMDSHNLKDIVEDSITLKNDLLERYSIKIEKDFKSVNKVHVQKSKLVHILLNLIHNAADAMVSEPPEQRKLSFVIEQSEGAVFLEVKDSGQGIPTDKHQKIFTHGYTTKDDGHGFGLHSSAKYMAEMNGKIWVENNVDQSGVTFILQFLLKS